LNAHALPFFANRKIETITPADISKLHNGMRERPYQANRMLAVMSSLFSFAERQGLVPEGFNPAKKVEKYREHRRRRGPLGVLFDSKGAINE